MKKILLLGCLVFFSSFSYAEDASNRALLLSQSTYHKEIQDMIKKLGDDYKDFYDFGQIEIGTNEFAKFRIMDELITQEQMMCAHIDDLCYSYVQGVQDKERLLHILNVLNGHIKMLDVHTSYVNGAIAIEENEAYSNAFNKTKETIRRLKEIFEEIRTIFLK